MSLKDIINYREPDEIENCGEQEIICFACSKPLLEIVKLDNSKNETKIRCVCSCGHKNFLTTIYGKFALKPPDNLTYSSSFENEVFVLRFSNK